MVLKRRSAIYFEDLPNIGNSLFLYFKKDLAAIDPEELASRVQGTVNRYLDRNGNLLWEDKGDSDYRLVVNGEDISTYMRQATVAIEDKNFYNHSGVDVKALIRAGYVTLSGGNVQGGSTLTQQLIKQVYFSEEAKDRTMSGIPRKIKEAILAIEVEKMYDKEQIITLYLNESPYGGRRNGVESAAQTYFGKHAKDLNLAESALLAAIPNNPAVLNPYNTAGNEDLIARQHKVLDSMVDMNYISKEEAEEAKSVDIIEQIRPEADQYENIKSPWLVLEVKNQLEQKYGIKTLRQGGFTITTTIDSHAQELAENAVRVGSEDFWLNGSDNATLVSIDVETGQVIAMVGSVDWNREGYGQVNAATSLLEPASSIKPILDYTPLFMQRDGINYAPGTILKDENINSIYCAGSYGRCSLKNYDGRFYGNIPIRKSLAGSLNIAAVKALYINGIENSLDIAHKLGDKSYCANGETAGLSMAIGGGCSVRPVEHANAYATLARGGVYKDYSYILEVKNSNGDVIEAWTDTPGERVVDPQVAYMTTSILTDANARLFTFGSYLAYHPGFYSTDVKFAAKTGTSENGNGQAKDSWIMYYSPVVATAIWNGNHDGSPLATDTHNVPFIINENYVYALHHDIYEADGRWYSGMDFEVPEGISTYSVNGITDVWPSWYNKATSSGIKTENMTFDRISKKKATECTPESTRVEMEVTKIMDPVTKKESIELEGWDPEGEDDIHKCSDTPPSASISITEESADSYLISVSISKGTHALESYTLTVDGETVKNGGASSDITYRAKKKPSSVSVRVVDNAGYEVTVSK